MNSTSIITWILLLVLTIASAVFSNMQGNYIIPIIMALAVIKFIGVAFQFMELKKAHSFWKYLIVTYLTLFVILILMNM